jgi:DNA-binding NarL/FixJ family response regulator
LSSKSSLPAESKKKNIFIVDDHPLIRQGLAQLIDREADLIFSGEAGNAQDALQNIKRNNPDLVIIDINLKGSSGIDLTTTLVALYPKILILIISMNDEFLYVARVLKAGARGYLMKEEATTHVITAIRKVLSGEVYISDQMKECFVNTAISSGKASQSPSENLSNREIEILQLIGQGLSTRQIAQTLHISIKTVDSHYANIKTKLNLPNSHALIQYAVKWTLMSQN